jgi:hypothetical protein
MKTKAKRFNATFYAILSAVIGVMLLVASFFVGGCARFQAGDISYLRVGNQTMDCKVTKFQDGRTEIEFKQSSKTEAMKVLVDAAAAYANK